MIRNYLLAALRSVLKHKSSFIINITGMMLGLCTCAVIGLYLRHELGYDRFHRNAERIYRLVHNETAGEVPGDRKIATVGPPVGPAFKETFSQVEDAVRFRYTPDRIISYKDQQHYEARIFYVDPSVFNVFSYPLRSGDAKSALSKLNSVVITSETATKYFGDDDPIGKVLTIDRTTPLEVTGVLEAIPDNAHLKFDFLLPFEAFRVPQGYPVTLNDWGWISFHTYVLLKPGEDPKAIEGNLHSALITKHWTPERSRRFKMQLQPLADIYLGDFKHEQVAAGNTTYLFVLGAAAVLILLVAGFNFANLFTVLTLARAKEIGVRKVIGAKRHSLAVQITGQAILLCVFAGILAATLLPLVVNSASWHGLPVELHNLDYLTLPVVLVLVAVIVGIFSGLYPSISLSGLDHQRLLKGSFRQSKAGVLVRNGMMLVQFIISIALISSVLVISRQMNYLKTKDLGYAKNELLLLKVPGDILRSRYPSLKNALLQDPNVLDVSIGGGRMDGDNGNVPIVGEGHSDEESIPMAIDAVTFDFFRTIGVKLVAGREFSEQSAADTARGVIINAAAARALGWDVSSAVGKKIRVGAIVLDGEVIGVAPDFHFGSLHSEIKPLVMSYPRTLLQDVYVRFSGENVGTVITSVASNWQTVMQDLPFDYTLMNDHLAGMYRSEQFFTLLFRYFAIIAIAIACLGLYGLISQDLTYRMKEIGIRKVLGATLNSVLSLVLKPVLGLVILANLFAWPLCWLAMNAWLSEFSYRMPMDWKAFPISAVAALTAALLATCYRAYAAANANMVDTLKRE
jgi:putative ABC transport system permease protein